MPMFCVDLCLVYLFQCPGDSTQGAIYQKNLHIVADEKAYNSCSSQLLTSAYTPEAEVGGNLHAANLYPFFWMARDNFS